MVLRLGWVGSVPGGSGGLVFLPCLTDLHEPLLVFDVVVPDNRKDPHCLGIVGVGRADHKPVLLHDRVGRHLRPWPESSILFGGYIRCKKGNRAQPLTQFDVGDRGEESPIPSAPGLEVLFGSWIMPPHMADLVVVNRRAKGKMILGFANRTRDEGSWFGRRRDVRQS